MSFELPDVDDDTRVDTYTELDVDERRQLLEAIEALEEGDDVELTWYSNRANGDVSATAVLEKDLHAKLFFEAPNRNTDIYLDVRPDQLTNRWHAPVTAYSTGNRYSSKEPRLGELVDVQEVDP